MASADKIVSAENLQKLLKTWRSESATVVFTNGCFDLVHLGHVDYLEKARNLGSKLILGLNSDKSISRIKGPSRPIVPQESRSRVLAAMEFVDAICFFEEDTPLELIQLIKPDILVKGDDYLTENIVGADFVMANGGSVKTVPLVKGFSTTQIIDKIKLY